MRVNESACFNVNVRVNMTTLVNMNEGLTKDAQTICCAVQCAAQVNSRSHSAVLHILRKEKGVRVDTLEKAIYPMLGWGSPPTVENSNWVGTFLGGIDTKAKRGQKKVNSPSVGKSALKVKKRKKMQSEKEEEVEEEEPSSPKKAAKRGKDKKKKHGSKEEKLKLKNNNKREKKMSKVEAEEEPPDI